LYNSQHNSDYTLALQVGVFANIMTAGEMISFRSR